MVYREKYETRKVGNIKKKCSYSIVVFNYKESSYGII